MEQGIVGEHWWNEEIDRSASSHAVNEILDCLNIVLNQIATLILVA